MLRSRNTKESLLSIKKRVGLLLAYWLVASIIAYEFAGYGDGSLVPFAVLVSWPGFFSTLLNQLLHAREVGLPLEILIVELSLFFLYYAGLIKLVSRLRPARSNCGFLIPSAIHLCGGLALSIILDRQYVLPHAIVGSQTSNFRTYWFIASYAVSLIITVLWFRIDWRLAKVGR